MNFHKFISYSISLILAAVFLLSAITKLNPIEILEFSIVETGFFNWTIAAILARIIIAIEIFIAIALVLNIKRDFVLKFSIAFLIGFNIYLFYIFMLQGNQSNCNCFGMHIILSPLESIIKNFVLIILAIIALYRVKLFSLKFQNLMFAIALIFSIAIVFIANPIVITPKLTTTKDSKNVLELYKLYNEPGFEKPSLNLKEGKWLILFASPTCKHCVIAAYKIHVITQKVSNLNVFFFINANEVELEKFHKLTKTHEIPFMKLGAEPMMFYTRGRLPAIYLIENQEINYKPNHFQLNEDLVKKWLGE